MAKKPAPKKAPVASVAPDGEVAVAPFVDLTQPPNPVVVVKPLWTGDEMQADHVFSRMASGDSLTDIAADFSGCSVFKLFKWFDADPAQQAAYARARDQRAHAIANRLYELADKAEKGKIAPDAARVAADIYKWTASKMLPKSYGDKIDVSGGLQVNLVAALGELSAQPVPPPPALPKD